MMFSDLISRADSEVLQHLLGKKTLRLACVLDPRLSNPERLREILLSIRLPQALLAEASSRRHLLELMRPSEASALCLALGRAAVDPFQYLITQRFSKNSDARRVLFDFFGVEPADPSTDGVAVSPLSEPSYGLFMHQREAIRKITPLLADDRRRVLLHMPTGSGKTRTAMNVVCNHIRAKEPTLVVWLASTEELCAQATEEFERAWGCLGDRTTSVARLYGDHEIDDTLPRDGIAVLGLQKLYSRLIKDRRAVESIGQRASLVVMDEAHQSVAPTFRLVLETLVLPYPQTSLLGLSATPGRTWSDISVDSELADFYSRRKVTLDIPGYKSPIDYLVSEGYLARPQFRSLFYRPGFSITASDLAKLRSSIDVPTQILDRLVADEQRNLCILNEIEYLARRHNRIIVFAASVEHSATLAAILRVRGVYSTSVISSTPREERAAAIEAFRQKSTDCRVLCNFGVLTAGFDCPSISAAVIARPTSSLVLYSQMVGRAIRGPRAGGNENAEIATVVDSALPGFGSLSEAFNNWNDVWSEE